MNRFDIYYYTMFLKVITWNIHNNIDCIKKLTSIIKYDCEIIIIALQEYYSNDLQYLKLLRKKGYKLTFIKFFGICTIFLSKTELKTFSTRLGLGWFCIGNKGSIITKIHYQNKKFIFINCHLSTKNKNYRQQQIDEILAVKNFFFKEKTIILAGDLNFRMDKFILEYNKNLDEFINGFEEGLITFKQTYKYDKEIFLMSRIPSWCDRILVYSDHILEYKNYDSKKIYLSDHLPVEANINIDFETYKEIESLNYYSNYIILKTTLSSANSQIYHYRAIIVVFSFFILFSWLLKKLL